MATIQVRDVPEEVHAAYRARAAAAGMSLQEYLRAELIEGARQRTPAQIAADVAHERRLRSDRGFSEMSSVALVRGEREAR